MRVMCSFSLSIRVHPSNNQEGESISKKIFHPSYGGKHVTTFARAIYSSEVIGAVVYRGHLFLSCGQNLPGRGLSHETKSVEW